MVDLCYHKVDGIEILGSATPVDIAIFTATTITHVTAMMIAIFSKFLYLQGNFQWNATLSLMARHNNKTKQLDTNDGGSNDNNSGKGLLQTDKSPVIPHFFNIIEEFEGFWDQLEIKLKQSCLRQQLERDPASKKGKAFWGNYSLHWILDGEFQDTDAEHIVKEPCKNYGERGYHVSRSLKNYYRLDNPKEEVQHRFRMQLYALKYNN